MSDSGGQAAPQSSVELSTDTLNSARATSDLARKDEAQGHYFDAAQKYESIAGEPGLAQNTTEAHLLKAVAHMDAARCLFYYGQTLTRTPELYESNRTAISEQLEAAHDELQKAIAGSLLRSADLYGWLCERSKVLAQSSYLQGMLNNSPGDLDTAIQHYQNAAKCEPRSKNQVDHLTSYITSVRRQMSHSPLSGDAIMKDISDVLHLAGTKGDFVSLLIQKAYEYEESHRTTPSIAVQ